MPGQSAARYVPRRRSVCVPFFDLDGDAREELSFKVRFGAALHSDDEHHVHAQSFEVRRASGASLISERMESRLPLAKRGALSEAGGA